MIRCLVHETIYCRCSVRHSALALLITLFLGCAPTRPTASPSPNQAISVTHADSAALQELIVKHSGQVVLVDYWATWCGPCVANFPHTVELAKKYKAEGLAVIAVSFDLLEDEAKVRDFLAKQGADFDNLISSHNDIGQKAWEDFDIGPLPEYRLYDRQGKLKQKWESGVDQAELEKRIQELLAEK